MPARSILESSPAWRTVLVVYVLLFGILLWWTDGYPYVLDNNESYSSLWHARSLYKNGVAQTKGLTDEVFSPSPAASPYIHSHQGNFPRLFTFVLYALGLRTIGPQIWVTTFTVGLAALWFAFRFFSRLGNPLYAALTCLMLMTDYLFFTQWQVGLYNIWHGFFFFSSLLCVQTLGTAERRGRWFVLALLNFAALFYWEYVFTAFVTVLCGLYAVVLYWRRFRLVWLAAAAGAAGAALAAGLLLAQLTAYMGWANVMEDVRLTLTARNAAADPVLLERVTSFYREHRIIFWHNFFDAAPLRNLSALWSSLQEFHLRYYTPTLLYGATVLGAGWALGRWRWAGWWRIIPLLLFACLAAWAFHWTGDAFDESMRDEFLLTPGGPAILAAGKPLLVLFTGLALACAVLGRTAVLGRWGGRNTGLLSFLLCSVLAYALTYRLFTGYIYSGYLHRFVPLPVFLTAPLLGLMFYTLAQAAWEGLRRAALHRRHTPTGDGFASPAFRLLPAVLSGLALAAGLAHWALLQATYARIAPADNYAFLSQLEQIPFKGRSLVTNGYPAPMAARTGSWAYADTSIFSGRVTLTSQGYEVERDFKYLWLADRETNPEYRRPAFVLNVSQAPNFSEAMKRYREWQSPRSGVPPSVENTGLFQRARQSFQPFLRHRVTDSDGRHFSIVRFDWDFPPYLNPQDAQMQELARQLTLPQKLALSAASHDVSRRWRVELDFLNTSPAGRAGVELTCDGDPVPLPGPETDGPQSIIITGDRLRLRLLRSREEGRVLVSINDTMETFDLHAMASHETVFEWSAAQPHGKYTRIPRFTPGIYLQTELLYQAGAPVADLVYRYTHQENSPEDATTVRLYKEDSTNRWHLADTVTFLGSPGVPVRLAEFRRANSDTIAEHARIVASGDARTYEQWLADHLANRPAEWTREGVVHEALPSPFATSSDIARPSVRRIPLPANQSGRFQFSVSPGTRTKIGPEYLGLPFTLEAFKPGSASTVAFAAPATSDAALALPLPFGMLRLKLRWPIGHWPQSEPIVTTGSNEAGDIVYVIYHDAQHIRLGFDHWFKGGPLTKPIPVDFTKEHELEISIGSLFPSAEDIVFVGVPADAVARLKNRVVIRLDGRTVIDSDAGCYDSSPDQVTVGRNTIRGTSCGPTFSGEMISIEREWPAIK